MRSLLIHIVFLWPRFVKIYKTCLLIRLNKVKNRKELLRNYLSILKQLIMLTANTLAYYVREGHRELFALWIAFQILSSTYTFLWDIKMDWGLFSTSGHKRVCLRRALAYNKQIVYYGAVFLDLNLKLAWLLGFSGLGPELVAFTQQMLEVFRRFMWNCFKIEYQWLKSQKLLHREEYKKMDEVIIEIND